MATLNKLADEIGDALNRPFDWQFKERIKEIFRHECATSVRQAINKDGNQDQFKTRFSAAIAVYNNMESYNVGENIYRTVDQLPTPIRYSTDDPFTYVGTTNNRSAFIYTKPEELVYADVSNVYTNYPTRYTYRNDYIYLHNTLFAVQGDISSIVDYNDTIVGAILITSSAHKLITGNTIEITNTVNYDSTYSVTVVDKDSFYVTATYIEDEIVGEWIVTSAVEYIAIEGAFLLGDVFDQTIENRLSNKFFNDDTTIPLPEDLIQGIKMKLLSGELSILDRLDKAPDTHLDN